MASISYSVAMSYKKSISFIELFVDSYMYDYILAKILIEDKLLLHFKLSKSGHILLADMTGFYRTSHI